MDKTLAGMPVYVAKYPEEAEVCVIIFNYLSRKKIAQFLLMSSFVNLSSASSYSWQGAVQ